MKLLISLIVFVIFCLGNTKLTVISPFELASKFTSRNNIIPSSVANFGHIPWGRKLIGPLLIADPFDACLPFQLNYTFSGEKPFVMVTRGSCTFVTKVRNAQNAGAAMVIISDNLIEASELLIMADDGFGSTVSIPSVFIPEEEGQIIKDYIDVQNKLPTDINQKPQQVLMMMKFDTVVFDPTSVMFALALDHRETYKLVREFQPHYNGLKNDVKFQVYYEVLTADYIYDGAYQLPMDNCLGGGRYCQVDPDGMGIATGRTLLEEQLRQICIFQTQPDLWWNYMDKFDLNCVEVGQYEFCSRRLQKQLGIPEQPVQQCVSNSYNTSSSFNILTQQNYILDNQLQFKTNSGVRFYPGAVINNQTYLGAIDGNDIFAEVCYSMSKQSSGCSEFFTTPSNTTTSTGSIVGIVIFVIIVLVVFFLFMLFIYRRMIRKEMSREMSTQVNQMVSQYISFYEAKDKRSSNSTQ